MAKEIGLLFAKSEEQKTKLEEEEYARTQLVQETEQICTQRRIHRTGIDLIHSPDQEQRGLANVKVLVMQRHKQEIQALLLAFA